jgi:Cd2+/Zn2+-exporting ATPase
MNSLNNDQTETVQFAIGEMDCPDCGSKIENRLRQVHGVESADLNFMTTLLTVRFKKTECEVREIEREVKGLGYSIKRSDSSIPLPANPLSNGTLQVTIISLGLALIGLSFSLLPDPFWSVTFLVGAVIVGGYSIGKKGLLAIFQGSMDMNVLMTIAVLGAIVLKDYLEAASVVILFSLAQWLESFSVDQTRKAIRMLIEVSPTQARIRTGDLDKLVNVEGVKSGERVIVHPEEKIPFDGVITKGHTSVNQASITGESEPVDKQEGESVYAGTFNLQGTIEIVVTHPWRESRMAKIMHMVEEASSRKASSQRFFEKFSSYYTPVVVTMAFIMATIPPILLSESWTVWFYRALVLIVIACPCALIISTPVTVVSALSAAARQGILIKGGIFLEELGRIKCFVFDKTGTLTTGVAEVKEVIPILGSRRELIQIAASLERDSKHPIGEAIVRYAVQEKISQLPVSDFQTIFGMGVCGTVSGASWSIGNHRFFEDKKLCSDQIESLLIPLEAKGNTTVMIGNDQGVIGIIALSDTLRPEAWKGIQELRKEGVERISMMTGDNKTNAAIIASQIHLDEFEAEVLPDEKAEKIGHLRKKFLRVAMVGDGINDAPALAAATVGIAIGEKGTEVAMETADVVLMSNNLLKLAFSVKLGRETLRLIRENLILSIGIKALFLILAVAGFSTLWMAVAADMGVSILVIANGMRIGLLHE